MNKLDIVDLTEWLNKGLRPNEFFRIFNVPCPTYREATDAIAFLGELIDSYSDYFGFLFNDNVKDKREQYLKLIFSDIFAELAMAIKLAAEGYVKYSLRNIRAALDLLFAGMYTISSWTEESLQGEDGINPMAEAFFSGYWGKMKSLDIDDLVLSRLRVGDEEKLIRNELHQLRDEIFQRIISKFQLDESKMPQKSILTSKKLLEGSLGKLFVEMIRNSDSSAWSELAKEGLEPRNFYLTLISDSRFVFRSCDKHEDELLVRLKEKLEIPGELTDELKADLRGSLTFRGPVFKKNDSYPFCDDCEEPTTVVGFHSRPDTRGLTKLIKFQLPKNELEQINSCIADTFSSKDKKVKGYFGDIVYKQIYVKLNDYAHSNIVDEPSIYEWYSEFILPSFSVFNCILTRLPWLEEPKE